MTHIKKDLFAIIELQNALMGCTNKYTTKAEPKDMNEKFISLIENSLEPEQKKLKPIFQERDKLIEAKQEINKAKYIELSNKYYNIKEAIILCRQANNYRNMVFHGKTPKSETELLDLITITLISAVRLIKLLEINPTESKPIASQLNKYIKAYTKQIRDNMK